MQWFHSNFILGSLWKCYTSVEILHCFWLFLWQRVSCCRPTACRWRAALQWRCARLCAGCKRTVLLRVRVWLKVSFPHPPCRPETGLPHTCWTRGPRITSLSHVHHCTQTCTNVISFILGDVIVSINGTSIEGSSHQHIVELIRESTNLLR